MHADQDWWRGAVIYQVYPRSFFDSNQDGIGDLPGLTAKLDYIATLGIDAIWLSPVFTSPMKDFGYDVADYRDIDPTFGTLEDFDAMVAKAHQLGVKVIIDQVTNHTSDQHPWFLESSSSQDNIRADWYVWADPKPDGTPPNNWLSVFGGSAWAWNSRRRQYYLHNFLASQPDLNYHNSYVVDQVISDLEFWLQRGVDGFRLDAVNYCYHDKQLRDNPSNKDLTEGFIGINKENPYAYQRHLYDKTQPECIGYLQRLRKLLDRYPGSVALGEIGAIDALDIMAEYTSGGDKLHMAYSFELLTGQSSSQFFKDTITGLEAKIGDGWPCWATGNHDVTRVATRWSNGAVSPARARMFMVMLLTLRGTPCIYQGEELGLTEAQLELEDLVDPYGIAFWPDYKGRDGCRTPMPWRHDAEFAGFSRAKPWLPIFAEHLNAAVSVQQSDDNSMLSAYREFIHWRKAQPALVKGTIEVVDTPSGSLTYIRQFGEQRLLIALNLSNDPQEFEIPDFLEAAGENLLTTTANWQGNRVHLPAFGVAMAWLKP